MNKGWYGVITGSCLITSTLIAAGLGAGNIAIIGGLVRGWLLGSGYGSVRHG